MAHKLLLADDSVTIQRVIELTFADEDIKVLAVGDGQQAVDRIEADPPDIILADVGMPKRNGYEVAAYVKSRPKLAHIPVVLLTGAFEPVDQARAIAVGCDGVLAKPFEPQLVISRVKELLAARETAAPRAPIQIAVTRRAEPGAIGDDARPEEAMKPTRSTAFTERAADVSVDTMRPPAETTDPNVSLNDYFDRLDAAFSKLGSSQDSPASASDRTSSSAPTSDLDWLDESALRKSKSDRLTKASDTLDFSDITGIDADRQDSKPRREELTMPQSFTQPGAGRPSAPERLNAGASTGTASAPPIADRFAALLAAEQGERPSTATAAPPSPPATPTAIPDAIVDEITTKVLEKLSDTVVRDTVAQLVSRIAERLVREEIARIKGVST